MKIAIKTNKTADITDLISKFVVFFDASIPTTIIRDANNKISGWLDRSLNAFHASQTTATSQPIYTSFNGFLGINCLSLSSINNGFLRFSVPANFSVPNGILYVATDKYVLPLPIDIPASAASRTFELTGGTSNILTGIILFNGVPTSDEDSRIVRYLTIKGANSVALSNLIMDFCSEIATGLYTNPLFRQINNLSSLLQSLDTSNVVNLTRAWRSLNKVPDFPLINISNVKDVTQAWHGNSSLTSFPALNFSSVQFCTASWSSCSNLTTFSAVDFRSCLTFNEAWRNCKLNAQSIDDILISIAAGLANNPSKVLQVNGGSFALTGTNNSAPTTINRRNTNNWNSWEFNLSQINENISGTIYDFRSGISGQQAKNWLAAKGWAIATN